MVRRKYRSQTGILHDILEVLQREGSMPAKRIATYANLPYNRLKLILLSLEESGLVVKNEEGYDITEKGLEAPNTLRRSRKLLESLGFRL